MKKQTGQLTLDLGPAAAEAVKWRPGQMEAIHWRGGELIVSASAGTGKTSVIIERAWQLVSSGRANVDELLVVTFTEDAAEQLKTRFRARLDQEMVNVAQDELRIYLRDQLHRLDRAQISTIHSLCLRIVHENYYRLGVGHDVRVLAPEQAVLLKHQILDRLFEEGYADGGDFGRRFRALVGRYGGRGVDEGLAATILQIHALLESLARPEAWRAELRELARQYRSDDFAVTKLKAWDFVRRRWLDVLADIIRELDKSIRRVQEHGHAKLSAYLEDVKQFAVRRRALLEQGRYGEVQSTLAEPLPKSPPVKKDSPDAEWWTPVKDEVDGLKDRLKDWPDEIGFALSPEGKALLAGHAEYLETLVDLVEKFSERLLAAKETEGHLEFDDLQRLAMQVLEDPAVAEGYRQQFKFVLVDEYQDINELQDALIRLLGRADTGGTGRITNLFMVGDVKQSIYRFRLAEPEIFQRLYRLAVPGGGGGLGRIDLPDNFRSRRPVIDSVNAIFTPILCGGELELEYDAGSRLVCAAKFPEVTCSLTTELHILERTLDGGGAEEGGEDSDFTEMEAAEREAFLTARRIKDLLDSKFAVTDNGQSRPMVPEDVVILLRSMRNVVGKYISMLRRVGLNAFCEQVEAFLEYPEIADIVAVLRILNNPYQDIPLATVLRSPLVGADLAEIARIRVLDRQRLFDGLVKFVKEHSGDPSAGKFDAFLKRYRQWRRTAACCCVAELVQQIYLETAYPDYVRASMPGEYGAENLNQFLHLAWEFSSDGRCDLPQFLSYLDLVAEQSISISGVQGGGGKGVRIQTVHRSKGLEYPVVVVANAGRKVNLMDTRADILFDRDLGVGLREVNPASLEKQDTLASQAISQSIRDKSIAEELRLLYVAMTRAKEKLILVGSARLAGLAKSLRQVNPEVPLSPHQVAGWESPLNWLTAAIASTPAGFAAVSKVLTAEEGGRVPAGSFEVTVYPSRAQLQWNVDSQFFGKVSAATAEKLLALIDGKERAAAPATARPQIEAMIGRLDWQYRWPAETTMSPTASVTQLMEQADESGPYQHMTNIARTLEERGKFTFLNELTIQGKERGTAWHTFMQHLDLEAPLTAEDLRGQIEAMLRRRVLTVPQARAINPDQVENFFGSEPGRLMLRHRASLRRELPFTFALPARDLPESIRPADTGEPVLIQGVIDCLVQTGRGFVIIDYKTNRIEASDVARMTEHYRLQIELYTRAISEILKAPVISAWLYFTEPNSAVAVK